MSQDTGKNIYSSETAFKFDMLSHVKRVTTYVNVGTWPHRYSLEKAWETFVNHGTSQLPPTSDLYSMEKGEFTFQRNPGFIKPEK